MKFKNSEDKEKSIKTSTEKKQVTYKRIRIDCISGFSTVKKGAITFKHVCSKDILGSCKD